MIVFVVLEVKVIRDCCCCFEGELRRKRMSVIEDDDEYPLYSCHYTHNSRAMGGALSNCGGDGDSYR